MGFLKRFLKNALHEGDIAEVESTSFEHLSEEEIATHLGVKTYDCFELTDAVRPSYDLKVKPRQGYRHDMYQDEEGGGAVPVIMAAATKELLMEVFIELLTPLGAEVDVVLETSHHRRGGGHIDMYRENMDMPVLQSMLWDYEDLLLNDGCTGIAVLNPATPQEVQFDEHKLLIIYGEPLDEFEQILQRNDIYPHKDIQFITEAEHIHSSSERFQEEFEQLSMRVGIETKYMV